MIEKCENAETRMYRIQFGNKGRNYASVKNASATSPVDNAVQKKSRERNGSVGLTIARSRKQISQSQLLLLAENLLIFCPRILMRTLEVGETSLDRRRDRYRRGSMFGHALDQDWRNEGWHFVGERVDERGNSQYRRVYNAVSEHVTKSNEKDGRATTRASW